MTRGSKTDYTLLSVFVTYCNGRDYAVEVEVEVDVGRLGADSWCVYYKQSVARDFGFSLDSYNQFFFNL